MKLLVATGLRREARILEGPGLTVICGGGRSEALEVQLAQAAEAADAIVSLGIGGALADGLKVGDWVVARSVVSGDETWPTDPAWAEALVRVLGGPATGALLGAETMLAAAADKRTAHARTGALAVDMESHVAARVARRFGKRFAASRVISDTADRDLPAAVAVGMTADGGMALGPVLAALARDPSQLGPLIRTGQDASRAFRSLGRGRRLLGPGLGLVDLRERLLDV